MNKNKENDFPLVYREPVEELQVRLSRLFDIQSEEQVKVYAYNCPEVGGFRIAEISIFSSTTGCSYIRGTASVHNLALILAAEDFVRMFYVKPFRPKGWDTDIDALADAECKLAYVVKECMAPDLVDEG